MCVFSGKGLVYFRRTTKRRLEPLRKLQHGDAARTTLDFCAGDGDSTALEGDGRVMQESTSCLIEIM